MVYRFPYIRITNLSLPEIAKFQYHPLIKVGLLNNSSLVRMDAYIDTGCQWCLFSNDSAKFLGIRDYKDTEEQIPLSGIGGKQSENTAYFHNFKLAVFKDSKNLKLQNTWIIETKIGFLDKPFSWSAVLGVYGFLDHFTFKTNIPEGYFEIEPVWE